MAGRRADRSRATLPLRARMRAFLCGSSSATLTAGARRQRGVSVGGSDAAALEQTQKPAGRRLADDRSPTETRGARAPAVSHQVLDVVRNNDADAAAPGLLVSYLRTLHARFATNTSAGPAVARRSSGLAQDAIA
jgi:hypothetical protein